jgi:hypothetical protein
MTQQDNKADKPRKVRGTATIYDDNRVEFVPQAEGTPQRKNEKKRGQSTFYHTNGEKESSIVAHLRVPANCEDPAAEMFEQLHYFTKDLLSKEPPKPAQKKLLEKEGVSVWHQKKAHMVVVRMEISTDTEMELSAILFNLTSEVNKCFLFNRRFLKQLK